MVCAIVSLRATCASLVCSWMVASFCRSIMLSRNTITVRAISPISSRACVAGMRAEVSPAASRFITTARPSSGRVMLRPISQEKPRPSATIAIPTMMMPPRVFACELASAVDACAAVSLADAMMASAIGNMPWLSMSMSARSGWMRSATTIHCAKLSA